MDRAYAGALHPAVVPKDQSVTDQTACLRQTVTEVTA